jgi:hypothetical protein
MLLASERPHVPLGHNFRDRFGQAYRSLNDLIQNFLRVCIQTSLNNFPSNSLQLVWTGIGDRLVSTSLVAVTRRTLGSSAAFYFSQLVSH